MPRDKIRDEHVVRASLQRCLESSVVVPTMFWTEPPSMPGAPYKPVPRCEGHALGIHGRDANIGARPGPDVVDLTLANKGCAVLPFSDQLWLFQDRGCDAGAADRPEVVVLLPDGKPVTLRAARRYAQSTPQHAAWLANPELATPWCTAPTLQLLTSQLRQLAKP